MQMKNGVLMGSNYKEHGAGSRKAIIREYFDRYGADIAFKHGLRLGVNESTLWAWLREWREKKGPALPRALLICRRQKSNN